MEMLQWLVSWGSSYIVCRLSWVQCHESCFTLVSMTMLHHFYTIWTGFTYMEWISYKFAVLVYSCVCGLALAYTLQLVINFPDRPHLHSSSTSTLAVYSCNACVPLAAEHFLLQLQERRTVYC